MKPTCRICRISGSNDLISVSKSFVYIEGGIVSISEIVYECLKLSVAQDDSISICENCNILLVQFYQFKVKFKENERIYEKATDDLKYNSKKLKKRKAKEAWKCSLCSRVFARNCQLTIHQKICPKSKIEVDSEIFEDIEYLIPDHEMEPTLKKPCLESILELDEILDTEVNQNESEFDNIIVEEYTESHLENIEPEVEQFRCLRCSWTFSTKYDLRIHQQEKCKDTVPENIKFFCCYCTNESFATKSEQMNHFKLTHNGVDIPYLSHDDYTKQSFPCEQCDNEFISEDFLNQHLVNKHKVPENKILFQCLVCSSLYSSQEFLKQHTQNCARKTKQFSTSINTIDCYQHHEEEIRNCPECSSVFRNHQEYSVHHQIYGKLKKCVKFHCTECNVAFSNLKNYETHLKNHKLLQPTVSLMNYPECETCFMGFSDQNYLDDHSKDHSILPQTLQDKTFDFLYSSLEDDLNKKFKCGHCRNRFQDKSHLNLHLMLFHATTFQCPFDQQTFNKVKYFIEHLKSRHPQNILDAQITCLYCNESLENKFELSSHRSKCLGRKFACNHCEKTFGTEKVLRAHLKKVTSGGFKCNICSKVCGTKGDLKTHQRFHNRERPFKCPQCDKRFSTQSHRASHLDTHRLQKVHQCTICSDERYFQTRGALRAHIDINHKQKWKSHCPYCTSEFTTKSHMIRHAQKIHKDMNLPK